MLRLLASMGDRTAIPFRIVFADGSEFRNGDARARVHAPVSDAPRGTEARRASATSRCSNRISTAMSTSTATFALALRAAFDAGLDNDANPLIARLQSLARVPVLEPLDSRRPRRTHSSLRSRTYVLSSCGSIASACSTRARTGARVRRRSRKRSQQDGPRLPQGRDSRPANRSSTSAAASAGCCSTRGNKYGAHGTGINTATRPARRTAVGARAARSAGQASSSSNATSARFQASTTSSCRSARSSTPGATSLTRSCARMPTR